MCIYIYIYTYVYIHIYIYIYICLCPLQAADKKTTLLHFTVETILRNAPGVRSVTRLTPQLAQASRVSLEEMRIKAGELVAGERLS